MEPSECISVARMQPRTHKSHKTHRNRDVDDLEEELQLRHLHYDAPLDQGKITLSKSCTCEMAT